MLHLDKANRFKLLSLIGLLGGAALSQTILKVATKASQRDKHEAVQHAFQREFPADPALLVAANAQFAREDSLESKVRHAVVLLEDEDRNECTDFALFDAFIQFTGC